MSSSITIELPRQMMSRITGGLYLAFVLAMIVADTVGHIGASEVNQTYEVLTVNPGQFTVGLVFGLLSAFLFVMAAWGLYVLLRPVNRDLALLFRLHAGLLGSTDRGPAVHLTQSIQIELRHRAAVLWHVVVPARLSGLQVRVPSEVPRRPAADRRGRRPDLVPAGLAASGALRAHLSRARRELRRRGRAGALAARPGGPARRRRSGRAELMSGA